MTTKQSKLKENKNINVNDVIKIVEKHLDNAYRLYNHDMESHLKGSCSYPLTAICCSEEHKWKDGIKRLSEKLRSDIILDIKNFR